MNLLAPSILTFDPTTLRESLRELFQNGADVLHLDVMDGQFVPPITYGPGLLKALGVIPEIPFFEAHLMTQTPERQIDAFAEAGCQRFIFHAEATVHAHRVAQEVRRAGMRVGVAINPGTPVEVIWPLLEELDLVLVMTVNPGWGGQAMIPATLEKVAAVRAAAPDILIEVDGGMNEETLVLARDAGADLFVVGSYLQKGASLAERARHVKAVLG